MWHTLKADIEYYKLNLLIGMSISVLMAIVLLALEFAGFKILIHIVNSFWFTFVNIVFMSFDAAKNKRDRHDALLPLPIRETAVSRLLFLTVYQLFLLALTFIFIMISGEEFSTRMICSLFSISAALLAAGTLFVSFRDWGFFDRKKYRWLVNDVLLWTSLPVGAAIGVAAFVYSKKWRAVWVYIYETLTVSPAGALLYSLIAAGLYFLSINIFVRRKSYLE